MNGLPVVRALYHKVPATNAVITTATGSTTCVSLVRKVTRCSLTSQ